MDLGHSPAYDQPMDSVILDGQPLTLAEIEAVSLAACPVAVAPAALARVAASRDLIERDSGRRARRSTASIPASASCRTCAFRRRSWRSCRRTWCAAMPAGWVSRSRRASRAPCCCCAPMCWPRASAAAVRRWSSCWWRMLNAGVHPVIPEKGSVGASGDLAPLAHLALVAIGEGEAFYKGERMPGGEALRRAGVAADRSGGQGRPGAAERDAGDDRRGRLGRGAGAARGAAGRSGRSHVAWRR